MANCYFAKPHGMQHCCIPFLYVIDFKSVFNFGKAHLGANPKSPLASAALQLTSNRTKGDQCPLLTSRVKTLNLGPRQLNSMCLFCF
jgi:hypothetical protein